MLQLHPLSNSSPVTSVVKGKYLTFTERIASFKINKNRKDLQFLFLKIQEDAEKNSSGKSAFYTTIKFTKHSVVEI